MSLFKTKEWWRTECGANETFYRRSLLIAAFFEAEKSDVVVVGSHEGYLRLYNVSSQWLEESKGPTRYKPTDLIIESRVCDCIIDVKAGRFVSGSQDNRLAVLAPSKLIIYTVKMIRGSTEHGDRCDLEIAYEHSLPRFPASLTVGPFGGARGRDFLCVQCLDGTLLFYEQESYAFGQILKHRLLPEPIVYISRNDAFVTANSAWIIECYRYQNMAEHGRKDRSSAKIGPTEPKSLEPDWCYNVGEAVLDITVVTLSSFEVGVVVLGERNLYCLKDNSATLKYAKRLEYRPLCFHAYVIEPDGKLMVLVIADTSTLMIYEDTTLKWSAQLPFPPVAVTRASFQHLEGAIVVLSEEGRLETCYLGTEPSLFIAPPVNRRGFDYATAEEELLQLRKFLKESRASGDQLTAATTEMELIVNASVSPDLEPSPFVLKNEFNEETDVRYNMCKITVELSSYTTLRDVQVCLNVVKPFVVQDDRCIVPNLCDRHVIQTVIYPIEDLPPVSSEVGITATYETDRGSLRVLQKTVQLPLRMMLRACPPENTSTFTVTIKCSEPLVGFNQLFPEFAGDHHHQRQNWNALGLQHVLTGHVVTIVSGSTSNRYRVQSNDGLSTTLVVQLLLNRSKEKSNGRLTTSIAQNHVQLVHAQMEIHFLDRQEIERISSEIGLLSTQLRNIERRMLRAIRERNTRSLTERGLPFLLESTYRSIFALLDELAAARTKRERARHGLRCALRLLLGLLRLNVNDDKYAILESAIGLEVQLRDQDNWEEITDLALAALLRSTSRKQGGHGDTKPLAWNKFSSTKDLARLKKRLVHVVERMDANRECDIEENEPESSNTLVT